MNEVLRRTGVSTALLVLVVAGCGEAPPPPGSGSTADPPAPMAVVRSGDLPTIDEVAAIYPSHDGGTRVVYPIDRPVRPKRGDLDCDDFWEEHVPSVDGRWASYDDSSGDSPYFDGEDAPVVTVLALDSASAAREAVSRLDRQIDRCEGHRAESEDEQTTVARLEVEPGLVGFSEHTVTPNALTESTEDWFVTIVADTGPHLVVTRVQAADARPDLDAASRLATLSREAVGRSPAVREEIPEDTTLIDRWDDPIVLHRGDDLARPLRGATEEFRAFVATELRGLTKDTGEWAMPECEPSLALRLYRSDGYARLSVDTCVGDGPGTDLLLARVDGSWSVVQEIIDTGYGRCRTLMEVEFPSQVAGTWCDDGSENGTDYPVS